MRLHCLLSNYMLFKYLTNKAILNWSNSDSFYLIKTLLIASRVAIKKKSKLCVESNQINENEATKFKYIYNKERKVKE